MSENMRIVSLVPSHTEILFGMGLGDLVVGVTHHCDHPPEAAERERVGPFSKPDLEKIVALRPDLVVAGGRIHDAYASELKGRGIAVYSFEPAKVSDLLDGMEELAELAGRHEGKGAVAALRERLERISRLVEGCRPLRTAFVMGEATLAIPGPENCQYDALRICGAEPMPSREGAAFELVSWEDVAEFNPEVLIVCGYRIGEPVRKRCFGCSVVSRPCAREVGAVMAKPPLLRVDAVIKRQVYPVPCHFFCRPGPRLFDGMEWLAATVRELQG
ncbi:MAG: ABC transporter substrate-binding protein [Thermacetogeniaceae bacterium]